MQIINNYQLEINRNKLETKQNIVNEKSNEKSNKKSFNDILNNEVLNKVNFSKHANIRIESRNINLSDEQLKRIENGIAKAKEKGIKESLVLIDEMALIVNVKSNTVITAVDSKDRVFTNIDGAVLI